MKATSCVLLALGVLIVGAPAGAITVFTTDFESGVPPEFSAAGASIQGVQGFAGLGPVGNQFAGNFLRYDSTSVLDTQLTLANLPPHDRLSLGFLLGVIDSWDGVELFEVTVDGVLLFSNSFQLATGDDSSYVAPVGALLSSGTDLGFSAGSYYSHDRAYDLSVEPAFIDIPHTADTVTIVWRLNATPGGGANFWQGGPDESWAIENVTVSVESGAATTTSTTTSSSTTTATGLSTTTLPSSSTTTVTTTTSTTSTVPAVPAQLLSGKKLILKWRPDATRKSLLNLLSKDSSITLGDGDESPDDPTIYGGSLRVYAAGGDGFDDTYDLPAEQWRYLLKAPRTGGGGGYGMPYAASVGSVIGYKFHEGDPIVAITVKPGKQVKIVGKGTALGHTLASDPRPVLVELRLGAERYCFAFGGTVKFTADKKYLAKDAPAAAACPP